MESFSDLLSPYHHQYLQRKNILPLTPPDEDTNTQTCLVASQTPKGDKYEEIEVIYRARISIDDVVVIRTTGPRVVLRDKGNVGASRDLLMRAEYYDIFRHRTVMSLQHTKETEM